MTLSDPRISYLTKPRLPAIWLGAHRSGTLAPITAAPCRYRILRHFVMLIFSSSLGDRCVEKSRKSANHWGLDKSHFMPIKSAICCR
jgi:hypothetical protein